MDDTARQSDTRRHIAYAEAMKPNGTDYRRSFYNRYLFAVLSSQTSFTVNVSAYTKVRNTYWTTDKAGDLRQLLDEHRDPLDNSAVMYAVNKAKWIVKFTMRYLADPTAYYQWIPEDDTQWRERIAGHTHKGQYKITGAGQKVASFLVCLCKPTVATVACIDTHMIQRYHGRQADGRVHDSISRKLYRHIEAGVRAAAKANNVGCFIQQWTEWDAQRGTDETHAFLADTWEAQA